jgi:ankyrin repeat protein
VNARDKKGQTAVRHVVEGNDYWDEERHADRAEVIRLLVTAGANVNARDEDGETALHEALDDDVVKALIKAGANVNVRNNNGETPLMTNVSVEVLKILVAAGADIHARDTAGRSVLGNVLQYEKSGPRVEYLRSLGIEETQKR